MALPRRQLRTMHLFAGAGGGILADLILGHRPVCAVEIDPYCRSVLLARQRDGALPRFPIWDDVRTFDGRPWSSHVDIVSGGFPCQDISSAGKGEGIAGERSGLWFEMLRVIGEVRPRFVFAENSPYLRTRGLGTVIQGLDSLGYDVRWCVLGAGDVGADHRRKRMWILARNSYGEGRKDAEGRERQAQTWLRVPSINGVEEDGRKRGGSYDWPPVESGLARVAHGMANQMERNRAIGNGQVPQCAALAWRMLS